MRDVDRSATFQLLRRWLPNDRWLRSIRDGILCLNGSIDMLRKNP